MPATRQTRLTLAVLCVLMLFAGPLSLQAASAQSGTARLSENSRHHDWPLQPPPPITRTFERPPHPYGPGHRGIDLGAAPGAEILASHDGVVAFAGQVADRGVMSIDHANGVRTTYEPVRPLVMRGDRVLKGTPIAVIDGAHRGCRDAACLHWGARRGKEYIDPRLLLGLLRIVLKPVTAEHLAG
ncbi:M23 family metallopeptidase [Hoyosella sp. YIM 151337]|uniref:M23 family metallopeptidase n=1 Tax=Hoyosella sp. YIM 151337 TaxID=2992742 RepID=UPI0022366AAD|nr:M23 family metallopeptidase [Hoyosella sp. YIM 151337]MCW4353937.1 M23 family metallopeptidase [Hoyosella sp. YIM 151337]